MLNLAQILPYVKIIRTRERNFAYGYINAQNLSKKEISDFLAQNLRNHTLNIHYNV